MVLAIDGADGTAENAALRAMFVARKQVFIDLLKWDLLALDGRFELDAFDDKHAHYLILLDGGGQHRASARLLSSMRPHLLDSLFSCLCTGAVPRAPHIYEITRFCLDPALGASGRRDARNQLVTALVDYALAQNISTYTGVAELPWLSQILAFGWEAEPLGPPRIINGRQLGALRIQIAGDTIARLQEAGTYSPTWRATAGD